MPTKVKLGTKGSGVYKGIAGFLDLKKAFADAVRQAQWEKEKLVYSARVNKDIARMKTFPYQYLKEEQGGANVATQLAGGGTGEVPLSERETGILSDVARTGMTGGRRPFESPSGMRTAMGLGPRQDLTKTQLTDKTIKLATDLLKKGTKRGPDGKADVTQLAGDFGLKQVSPGLLMYDDPIKGRQFIKTEEASTTHALMNIMLRAQELEEKRDYRLQDLQIKRDTLEQKGNTEQAKILEKQIKRKQDTALEIAMKKLGFQEARAKGPVDADYLTELNLSREEQDLLGALPSMPKERGFARVGRRFRQQFEPVLREFDDFARKYRADLSVDDAFEVIKRLKKKGVKLRRSEVEVLMDRARQLFPLARKNNAR